MREDEHTDSGRNGSEKKDNGDEAEDRKSRRRNLNRRR